MALGESRRWGAFAVAGGAALAVLLLIVAMLSRETDRPAPPPITSVPTSASDPAVASVNGQPIGRNLWTEAVLVDHVMSDLAGISPTNPEETLEMLINEVLVVEAALPQETPTDDEVEAQIATLEAGWGVGDEQVVAALAAAGLSREALVRTVTRLLLVLRAQEALEEEVSIEEWLTIQREHAQIEIDREQMETILPALPLGFLSPLVAPAPNSALSSPPTPEQRSPLLVALDFTLERAGGGTLTLSDQLTHGPVVLVFFQRCG